MAALAALAAGAGACLVLGQFQSSAQFGDAGPHTHPFVLVPSTLAPALLLAAPTPQAKPTLAWPPRLVSTLPATNLPLETRLTCTSGSAFSHLGSARDPRLVS